MRQLLNRASLSSPLIPRLNPGLLPREAEVRLECDTVRGGCVRSYGRIVLFLISTIFVSTSFAPLATSKDRRTPPPEPQP